ncbi:MAG: MFS transporter [Streptosporangiales bacterium]|nr:MFS transporter [Streptosporangiales bacterium]
MTRHKPRLVALSSYIGTTIEWYDFFLYGTAAAVVFNKLFFPKFDPAIGTMIAFASLGIAYLARPLGGIVIAHFGDRIGRKRMLVATLMIMGIATVLVGLLPSYQTIGIWAPILLLALRALQGVGIGGEYGGAVLLVVEYAPRARRGIYGSITQLGAASGLLLSAGAFSVFSSVLGDAAFLAWGWRIPFLLSVVLLAVGLFIRLTISESPAFERMKAAGRQARMPLASLVRHQGKATVFTIGQRLAEACVFNIYVVYVLAYITGNLGLPRSVGVTGTLIAAGAMHVSFLAFGALSDVIGRRRVYLFGAAFSAVFAVPAFLMFNTGATVLIWLAIGIALVFGHSAMYGPLAAWWTEQFRTNVRYSGVSAAYQVGGVLGGGFAPLIASSLIIAADGAWWPVPMYVIAMCAISIVTGRLAEETYRQDLEERITGEKADAVAHTTTDRAAS